LTLEKIIEIYIIIKFIRKLHYNLEYKWDLFLNIMGVYIIEENLKVPKTVLEDVWAETIRKLKINPEFNLETVEKIDSMVKARMIIPNDIIDLLNG
jgi:hypothetical protein